MVIGQLARPLGLPLRCAGSFTTSKLPDGQAMQESVMSMLSAVHCGANFILHSAGFLDGLLSMSYEKFMMDADFCGALHRYLEGVSLAPDEFAIDGFHEVGPGKHFFGSQHTLRHYETAFYEPMLSDWRNYKAWEEAGSVTATQRAHALYKRVLADYEPPPIDPATKDALDDFVARRKREIHGPA